MGDFCCGDGRFSLMGAGSGSVDSLTLVATWCPHGALRSGRCVEFGKDERQNGLCPIRVLRQTPGMAKIDESVEIDAAPEQVFKEITDFENAERIDAIVSCELLTEGEIGVGTRFRETRVVFKKEHSEEMEVVAFDPPKSYTVEANSCGTKYISQLAVRPAGEGCVLTMSFEGQPQTLVAKVMSPMFFFMKGTMRKMIRSDLECIRRLAEGNGDEASSG